MKGQLSRGAFLCVILTVLPSSVPAQEVQFHKLPIHRLSPRAFPNLPRGIIRALESGGYTIPQLWTQKGDRFYTTPHNVIRGSFRRRGQWDWAVLCSRHDSSAIVIFWNGNASNTTTLAQSSDDDWTQSIDDQRNLGYSRLLEVASPKRLLDSNLVNGAPADNPSIRSRPLHDGIEDYFEGKASTIHYFERGRLVELSGSD